MKKPKTYKNRTQQKSPTHLTSADEAWKKMAAFLDAELPVANQGTKKRAFAISFSQFAISIVAAMIIVGGGTLVTLKTIENRKELNTSNHTTKYLVADSLNKKTIQLEDSAISTQSDVQAFDTVNLKTNNEEKLQLQPNNQQTSTHKTFAQTKNTQKTISAKSTHTNKVIVENTGLETEKSKKSTISIDKQQTLAYIDTLDAQQNKLDKHLQNDADLSHLKLETKTNANDNLQLKKVEETKKDRAKKNPTTNHFFIGISGFNGLLFSNKNSKNFYSYGELLTIGLRNTTYNLSVEAGIGFQYLEYHIPYSRTLYTYKTTGSYDSTITVSSYKYSRKNIIIPLYFSKEILHSNKVFLDVKTGLNTSILLSNQRLFKPLPNDIQLIEDANTLSDINFSVELSPQLRWKINEKFSVRLNANAILYLNSLYQNYSLKPIGINLSTGIYYSF